MATPGDNSPPWDSNAQLAAEAPSRGVDRETYPGEWAELDAEDLQSALEERLWPEQEHERYDGPLRSDAWLAERRRSQALDDLGIERPELDEPYRSALGSTRAYGIERRAEDAALQHAYE